VLLGSKDVGLTLLSQAGACDFTIAFDHEDGADEDNSPFELLRRTEHELPSGQLSLHNVYAALGESASGGAAGPGDFEFRIRSKLAPQPERINVRRGTAERLEELRVEAEARRQELMLAQREKADVVPKLRPGEEPPHTRDAKLAYSAAAGAQATVEMLVNQMPTRFEGENPNDLQFEWLPEVVRDSRLELSGALAKVDGKLSELQVAAKERKLGKQQMLFVDNQMAELRQRPLPAVEPVLEEAGSIIYSPMHHDFFHSAELTAGRRALAVALAKHAAMALIAADQQISHLEAEQLEPDAVFDGHYALDRSVTLQRSKALMLMTQDITAMSQPITPERVLSMAAYLGIVLDHANMTHDAEPEYCFLWIAVEALRTPLPPLWHRRPDGQFEHSVTHETTVRHPMLPVYVEFVLHERARKKTNRPFQALERFMLFATEGENDSGFTFFNFATRQYLGGRKLPAEAVAEQAARRPPPPPPRKTAHRATAASVANQTVASKHAPQRNRASVVRGTDISLPRPKPLTKEQQAALRSQASVVRRTALALRPRALPELMVAARKLNVDLVEQPHMVWLVDLCLACDYLPVGWSCVPREQMSEMAHKHDDDEITLNAVLSSGKDEQSKASHHVNKVTKLPPLERLWHVATTGVAPPQYEFRMCTFTTERHPLSGFVRMVMGVDPL